MTGDVDGEMFPRRDAGDVAAALDFMLYGMAIRQASTPEEVIAVCKHSTGVKEACPSEVERQGSGDDRRPEHGGF